MPQKLAIVTANYPSPARPSSGTFVREFVRAVASEGTECTVIAPIAWHDANRSGRIPYADQDQRRSGINVYRPRYVSIGAWPNLRRLGVLNPTWLTYRNFRKAVETCIETNHIEIEALYGHFLYFGGAVAAQLALKYHVPSIACVGEGRMWTLERFGLGVARRHFVGCSGFVANNAQIAKELNAIFGDSKPCIALPNGVDQERFAPRDKMIARAKFGIPADLFVVCSVGNFTSNKGINRVAESIKGLTNVVGVFAGSGACPPVGKEVFLSQRIDHEDLPWLLSASDLFVLPTLIEGSCNAILEAMACGLPIVSSNRPFNDEVLGPDNAILVDPLDVQSIREAIICLRDQPTLRSTMQNHSRERSRKYSWKARAEAISSLIQFVRDNGQYDYSREK